MMMVKQAIVTVPHGFASDDDDDGSWVRTVQLRQLNGYDERHLEEMKEDYYPIAFRTTALLSRVIKLENNELKSSESDSRKTVQKLTVGDRIALMLHLRRLTFGDTFHCTLSCPSCKEAMSLDLSISSFLQPPIPEPRSEYTISVESFTLKVVPVTGAKVEAVLEEEEGEEENDNESQLVERLVRSCIISSEPKLPEKLTDNLLLTVSAKLEELDPQADIVLDAACPDCQHSFQTPFNVEEFIFQEIGMRQKELDKEVHWLAFHYHWSEDSILSLSLHRRKKYVELINRTLSGESV